MPQQINPDELIGILNAEYQPRAEPNFALAKACSTTQALSGLRGFWPMSSFGAAGEAFDLSRNAPARTLTNANSADYGYDALAPYCSFNGTTQYLHRADEAGLDILGTEGYVGAAFQGLTLGGWFWFSSIDAATEYLISKQQAGVGGSYVLQRRGTFSTIRFEVNGGVGNLVDSTNSVVQNQWNFVVGRFVPSTTDDIYVNGVKTSAGHAVAAIANTAHSLVIGADTVGAVPFAGRVSMCFLCAAALSDAIIQNLYQQFVDAKN